MKSKNEEYLDSLLNSLKKDANSGIAKTTSDPEYTSDLNDVIGNSSGSNDLSEIGEMLGKVDSGQLLDEGMTKVLDSIVAPAVSDAPTYTVGDDVSDSYEKDDDERALDEEIARAEAAIEEAAEIQPDDTDALLEVAPEIPIDDLAQNDEVEQNSTDAAIDDMMRATPEEVLGVDFGAATTPSDEMLNINEMLDAGTGEGEEVGLDDTLSLDGLEDLGGEAMPQEDLSVLLDSGDESSSVTDEALSVDGLFDAEPTAEAVAEEVSAEPSVDAGLGDINIDEMMSAEPTSEETVGDINIDEMMSAEPSADARPGDINIDEMMAAEPAAEGAVGDINIDEIMSTEPSLGDINIDEMMAAEPVAEGAVSDVSAEPAVDAGLGDINIDEMMSAEPAIEDEVGDASAEPSLGDINIDEMMSVEPATEGEVVEETAEPTADAGFDDINIDEMLAAAATEGEVGDVSAESAVDAGLGDINIDEMMATEPSTEGAVGDVSAEPSLGDINIDEMMAAEPATEGEVAAEPSIDAGLGDINIDEMMSAEPATEGAVADVSAEPSIEGSVSDVSAEPSLGDINIDEMMAMEPSTEGAVGDVSAEPVAEEAVGDINIDEMMADAVPEVMPDEISLDDMLLEENGVEDSSIEEVMGMDASAEAGAGAEMPSAEAEVGAEIPVVDAVEGMAAEEVPTAEPAVDEMPAEEIVAEEPAPEEAVTEDVLSIDGLTEEAVAEDALSIDGLTEEVATEEPVIEEAVEEMSAADALEGEVAVEEMILDEEESGEAPVEDAPAEDSASAETASDGEISDEMLELDQSQIDRMLSGDDLDEAAPEAADGGGDELSLDDLSLDGLDLSLDSPEGVSEEAGDDVSFESVSAELDDLLSDVGEGGAEESLDGESMGSESELDSMLADLGGEGGEGGSEPADVDMPDLDAIMNSLASDDVEDLENTAHIDEKEGANAGEISLDDIGVDAGEGGEEVNPEDIMEALEGDGLDEIGLSDDIPDPDEVEDNGGDYDEISLFDGPGEPVEGEEGGKKKKKKRPNLLFLIIAALFKVLTQTDEDLNPKSEEDGLASLTDENQQVLDELAAEDGKKAKKEKKKKEKKEKPKKEPKPKKEKKPKPPKEPKPKKEKKKKVDDGAPEKALAPKKVAISMIFAVSLGLLCCIPSFVLPGRIIFGRAQTAYEHGDYKEAYKLLYGKQLNEEQALLYNQARVLANANHYLDSYNNYIAMNMKDEAVDSLLIGMRTKNDVIAEAEEFQVAGEVESVYSNIESILTGEYGLTLAEIEEVNKLTEKAAYTKRIMEIAGTLEDFIHPNG